MHAQGLAKLVTLLPVAVALCACQALVLKVYGVDAAKYRVAAANPITSGKPLSYGFEQSTDSACDKSFVGNGWKVRLDGDRLCLDERFVSSTSVHEGAPAGSGGLRSLRSDAGETEPFSLSGSAPKRAANCATAEGDTIVWIEEKSGCVANNGVLTEASTFLAMHWKGLGAGQTENLGWSF